MAYFRQPIGDPRAIPDEPAEEGREPIDAAAILVGRSIHHAGDPPAQRQGKDG